MQYIHIEAQHRERINALIRKQWYTTVMVIRGQEVDMGKARGIFADEDGCIVGLVTYSICDGVIEILSLTACGKGRASAAGCWKWRWSKDGRRAAARRY